MMGVRVVAVFDCDDDEDDYRDDIDDNDVDDVLDSMNRVNRCRRNIYIRKISGYNLSLLTGYLTEAFVNFFSLQANDGIVHLH
jgi:hypothetical protein